MRVALFAVSCAFSYLFGAPASVTKGPASIAPHATEKAAQERDKKPAGAIWGRSVGSPTEGHLIGGSHLDEATYLRIVPSYAYGDVRWGTGSLVGAIDRSARQVRRQFPDAVLSAGQLSRQGGGEIDRHASHESGRDADLGFYIRSQTGKPLLSDHFVPFVGDGSAPSWPGAYFDDARNWALVASLVTDGVARVSHLFVATPLRARLLSYAEKIGAPMHVRVRASEVMAQPHGALPHDDHFHVRIECPANMPGCVENPTMKVTRFARVPVPRGRNHTGRSGVGLSPGPGPGPSLSPSPSPSPSPNLGPGPSLSPSPSPSPSPGLNPNSGAGPGVGGNAGPSGRAPEQVPAMLIDDVDGIFDPDPH